MRFRVIGQVAEKIGHLRRVSGSMTVSQVSIHEGNRAYNYLRRQYAVSGKENSQTAGSGTKFPRSVKKAFSAPINMT